MRKSLLILVSACFIAGSLLSSQAVSPSDVSGIWEGTLRVFGQSSSLVFRISVDKDGKISALHDAPDYSLNNIPVAGVDLRGDSLFLSIGLYNGNFEGQVRNGVVEGRYGGEAGLWFPLLLKRRSSDPNFLMDHTVPRLGKNGKRILEYVYTPPVEGDDGWPVADAAALGIDTVRICALMRSILAGQFPNLHSVLMVKDGKIVFDEYFHGFTRDKQHRLSSVSKVITAATVGVAFDKGIIKDLHTPLSEFFPEYQDLLGRGEKSSISLYHMLTMTAGLKWNEHATSYFAYDNDLAVMKRSPDPFRHLFERPLVNHPGEQFVYNTGNMIVLDAVVQRTAKVHPLVLAQNELFTPMGIGNYRWDFTEGFYMVPRDMAKLGWLFQGRGEYNGKRILSASWVDSSIQRVDRRRPKYFNHWMPMVFFEGGIPIRAFQAGGWGGQSITLFPTLNTVIVLTAGNMLESADYDVCIRDYLLPAILTPQYISTHQGIGQSGMHQVKNLTWEKRWDTEMGCLRACAESIGRRASDAMLYGVSGVGFLINIDETAAAKSMAVWNKQGAYELCRNLGFSVESIWSHVSNPEFAATQRLVWDRVRLAIDSGYACYGFHFEDPIRYLVMGYDSLGYYYKGWGAEWGEGPVFWYDLGRTDIGLLGMHFVRPVTTRKPIENVVKEAFQFVLAFSANSKEWVPGDCRAGPEGYSRWIALFESGKEDGYGVSYNAIELAEARKYAVEFLEELKSRLDPSLGQLFDKAIQQYRIAADNLGEISRLFPHDASPMQRSANLKKPQKRQAAVAHLERARDAEVEGLEMLAAIMKRL